MYVVYVYESSAVRAAQQSSATPFPPPLTPVITTSPSHFSNGHPSRPRPPTRRAGTRRQATTRTANKTVDEQLPPPPLFRHYVHAAYFPLRTPTATTTTAEATATHSLCTRVWCVTCVRCTSYAV